MFLFAQSLLTGLLIVGLTFGVHLLATLGLRAWLSNRTKSVLPADAKALLTVERMSLVTFEGMAFLFLVHMVEAAIWASAYMIVGQFETYPNAFYFAAVTYSSLGFGDIVLDNDWRILSAIQALNGIFAMGWSSALMFGFIQRLWHARSSV